jgi:hypothetical protein
MQPQQEQNEKARAKRKGTASGKQHVAQPEKIAKKTKRFRSVVT